MQFTVNAKSFTAAVERCALAVETKSTIPILLNVLIEAGEAGVTITGTDLQVGVITGIDAQVTEPGSYTLPVKPLLKALAAIGETVTVNDGVLTGEAGYKVRIPGMAKESYPDLPRPKRERFSIPAPQLAEAIQSTEMAISAEESRFTLNGVLVEIRAGRLQFVATDGHRLAYVAYPVTAPDWGGIVPRCGLSIVAKLIKKSAGKVTVCADDNHVFFATGDTIVLARKLTGNFPDYERVMPRNWDTQPLRFEMPAKRLADTLKALLPFADDRSHAIRVSVNGLLKMHACAVDMEMEREFTDCSYAGEGMAGFNADYMLDFARIAPKDAAVEMRFDAKGGPGEMRISGDLTRRYVVMPMRM